LKGGAISVEEEWSQARIQKYINDETEESLALEYKAAGALGKIDDNKKEITKDVSAMANSAGGIIVYGVKKHDEDEKRHLPERIDPITRSKFSKEWLEQVINNIKPRINEPIIHSVSLDTGSDDVVYVVDIPQSTIAHQAKDYRYYKRYNYESVLMEDYEIRDVMNRLKNPRVELDFEIQVTKEEIAPVQPTESGPIMKPSYDLRIVATNTGPVYAKYVSAFVLMPFDFLPRFMQKKLHPELDESGQKYHRLRLRADKPILPELTFTWSTKLRDDLLPLPRDTREYVIRWSTHSDNAPAVHGEIIISDIEIVNSRRN
jgi:hypothetical protein